MKSMIDDLAAQAWAWNPRFLDESECLALLDLWSRIQQSSQPASISKHRQRRPEIRGDSILWLEDIKDQDAKEGRAKGSGNSETASLQSILLSRISTLQDELNRNFFLNLRHFEGHFAHYPSGAGYQAHYDQARLANGQNEGVRLISLVLYLNPNWRSRDGGELVLWQDESRSSRFATVEPRAGTAVIFRSDEIYHEVLPTTAPRLSLTGWFRREPPTQNL